jgi:hypothetical protein
MKILWPMLNTMQVVRLDERQAWRRQEESKMKKVAAVS